MALTTTSASRSPRRLERWLFGAPLWQIALAGVGLAFLLFGAWHTPNIDRFAGIAADPFDPPLPESTLLSSPLGALLASTLGASTATTFTVLHAALVVLSVLGCTYLLARWMSDRAARLFVIAWFASPLANVMSTWLGQPDPFTMAAAVFVTAGPVSACFVGGLLLGFNHFEQGLFIVAAATVIRLAVRRESWRTTSATFVGLAVGRLALAMYHDLADVVPSRLGYIAEKGAGPYVQAFAGDMPTWIFSVYGVLWLPLVVMLAELERRTRVLLVGLQLLFVMPVLVALDTTRVAALITWPIVVFGVSWWSQRPDQLLTQRYAAGLALAATIVPRVVVWEGSIYVSAWGRILGLG